MLTESCSHRYQSCIFSLITTIGYFSSHSFTPILVSFKLEQHVFSASFCTLFLCRLTSSLIYIHNQVIIHPLIACLNQSGSIFTFFFTKYPNAESKMYVFAQSSFDLIDLPYACINFNAVCQ